MLVLLLPVVAQKSSTSIVGVGEGIGYTKLRALETHPWPAQRPGGDSGLVSALCAAVARTYKKQHKVDTDRSRVASLARCGLSWGVAARTRQMRAAKRVARALARTTNKVLVVAGFSRRYGWAAGSVSKSLNPPVRGRNEKL
jgi:hypothetical protein